MSDRQNKSAREILPGFIVLEGLDGSGTTTQAARLTHSLEADGHRTQLTAEPTTGPIGRMIRDALHRRVPLETATLVYLFAADRHEHLWGSRDAVTDHLQSGFVVSDRYVFSSLAYQTIDAPPALVEALNGGFPYPEHLIYIDVTPELAEERRSTRKNPDIFENLSFQRAVAQNYENVLRATQGLRMQIHRVDGSGSEEEVAGRIWDSLGIMPINSV